MSNTLLFGLTLFDIIEGEKYIGGPAINIALHMACYGCDPTVVSCVGNDELGETAKKLLTDNKISTEFINTDYVHETGWVNVFLDEHGNPKFEIIKPVAYDFISLSEPQINALSQKEFDILYFGTVVQRNEISAETLRQLLATVSHKEVFFDFNLRPGHFSKEIVDFSLSHTNILKLNEDELQLVGILFGAESKDEEVLIDWIFSKYPPKIILLTRGEKGATLYTSGKRKDIKGIKVKVKDTVGSGDAFSAGFIMEYINSGDIFLAAQKGNELGAYVATRSGAVPELNDERYPD